MENYMRRCFQLAQLGAGNVSPNPLVGAVLVYGNRIIGEGWHRRYGEAHAEVLAIRSVAETDRHLIPHSTLYCSLEPCFHFGKTPPCVDLILAERIPRVVVANTDPNPLVGGQSLKKLQAAGVEIMTGVLEAEGRYLNRAFFTWIEKKRPHIVLKWAQTADGFLARSGERTTISGPITQRLVHRWRAEADAILVGTTTAVTDNPRLDNRMYFGKSPLRIALDFDGKISTSAHLLDDSQPTWIVGPSQTGNYQNTRFLPTPSPKSDWIPYLLENLTEEKRAILLVEGGAIVLRQFIKTGYWDEIRLLENPRLLHQGVPAPAIPDGARLMEKSPLGDDSVRVFWQPETL
ncbi:MAG: bifunctional diaminohydroxyphosphoribosylaminopyrimidine deaminase/5-amino-6-(5-phosphoribosylamino)uracil reductase RibD [Saprospiraceae bacterium]